MLQIPCHRLLNPVVLYDQSRTAQADATSGRWDLRGKNFLRNHGRHDFHFVFLVPNTLRARDTVRTYAAEFENQIQRTGVGRPRQVQPIQLASVGQQDLAKALQTASSLKQRPNVVILLLPAKNIPVYSSFKYLSDRVFGLQSIVMTEEKCLDLRSLGNQSRPPQYRGTPQYMGNIMMKANLKNGGVNHASQLVQDASRRTLVLGADVTHPSPGCLPGAPSVAALVGSIGNTGGKFFGELSLQRTDRNEVGFCLSEVTEIG